MPNAEGFKFFKGSVIHENSIMNHLKDLPLHTQRMFWHNASEENMRFRSMEIWYKNGCIGGFSAEEDVREEIESELQT